VGVIDAYPYLNHGVENEQLDADQP
jgi:hypothetical protein